MLGHSLTSCICWFKAEAAYPCLFLAMWRANNRMRMALLRIFIHTSYAPIHQHVLTMMHSLQKPPPNANASFGLLNSPQNQQTNIFQKTKCSIKSTFERLHRPQLLIRAYLLLAFLRDTHCSPFLIQAQMHTHDLFLICMPWNEL